MKTQITIYMNNGRILKFDDVLLSEFKQNGTIICIAMEGKNEYIPVSQFYRITVEYI